MAQRQAGVDLTLSPQLVREPPFATDVVGEGQGLACLRDVVGRVLAEDVADAQTDARAGRATDHRLDAGTHVFDVQVVRSPTR